MGFQTPKADHPWRQYANKPYSKANAEKEKEKHIKSVKILVTEISESWDKIEVFTFAYGREGKFYLNELSQAKQAAWLAGLLKRNYGN